MEKGEGGKGGGTIARFHKKKPFLSLHNYSSTKADKSFDVPSSKRKKVKKKKEKKRRGSRKRKVENEEAAKD